jgi:PEGA domain
VAVLFGGPTARAQDARAEARVHFQRAVELYDEGRLVEALSEFEEAYRISPAPTLLYNLAQIHADLGHAVEAADAYQRFLADPGDIDAELRREAEAALRVQRARIGRVRVTVSVEGARVFLDDVEIGASPLAEPLAVSAGEHVVVVQIAGFETQRHRFRVAGGATYEANLVLVASGSRGASLRIESTVPGVDIRVDGASMGLTPLDATVPVAAGTHRVEGVREGYLPFQLDVSAVDGSETRVVVQTSPDAGAPAASRAPLRIALPATSITLRIDGALVEPSAMLEVPVGLHDLEIRAAEREPIAMRVDVPPTEGLALEPSWTWTPDARESRVATADAMRVGGWGTLVPGLVLFLGGVPTLIGSLIWFFESIEPRSQLNEACMSTTTDFDAARPRCIAFFRQWAPGRAVERSVWLELQNEYNADNELYTVLATVGGIATGLGAVALVTGTALVVSAPSTSDIDRGARSDFTLELDVGPASLGVHGSF